MLNKLLVAALLINTTGCRTTAENNELSSDGNPAPVAPSVAEEPDLSGTEGFTGFCRPEGECEQSCDRKQLCYAVFAPKFCNEKDPGGGDFACFSRLPAQGPKGPPGGAELWNAPQCMTTAQECRASIPCKNAKYWEVDFERCSVEVEFGYVACYCKKAP
jgi:hypothetical protein